MPSRPPLVIGHRGAPGYRPEHSRSSYELAFAMGVDAVEPDVVASRDGVLVVRHENEISGTTDVADRPEFAGRRTTKTVDGRRLAGWFTEDFTWEELATLRARERLPAIRPSSAAFDGSEPLLTLVELLGLVREASADRGREIGVVLEVKHATHFAAAGLDLVPLVERDLRATGWLDGSRPLVVESFEPTVLARLRERGVPAAYVSLLEAAGAPFDLVARDGAAARTYAEAVSPDGLDDLADAVEGISVDKRMLLERDPFSGQRRAAPLVAAARERGLQVYTWTCRPENAFLAPEFRGAGGGAAHGDYAGEWRALRDSGVDGVFVDHADLGAQVFRAPSLS
ncbi:glycerophosphodiester phosphodiesterase family protein [Microbacterium betulae]|uniref:glycerophosphodiester phosphodiesterase n=1 Tax=Microbacterium betulae TaxID=2981139 RepID=A0AA97FET8_9MICO|nr:glycerophosphodiester phosphodiesterase family protein [Microbacterium sp. AB]WOF22191.1 glycerophosphodiester phosphodiesterase family protein [Microbacterium sp. AB]